MICRKECGLEKFVPSSLAETMKRKELRKLLGHFLKLNSSLTAGGGNGSGQKNLTALQAKLHYLKIISDLPSYGAKCFSTNMSVSIFLFLYAFRNIYLSIARYFLKLFNNTNLIQFFQDSNVETVILISPKFGLSQINSLRNSVVSIFLNSIRNI